MISTLNNHACFYYLEFLRRLILTGDKLGVYKTLQTEIGDYLKLLSIDPAEIEVFHSLLKEEIHLFPEERISSDGYVVHILEAGIWSIMTTDNFKDTVLKAINSGGEREKGRGEEWD